MVYAAIIAIFIIYLSPLLGLLLHFNLYTIIDLFNSESFLKSLTATLVSGIFGSLFSMFFGLLFAKYFTSHQWRFKRFQRLIMIIPYLVPNFVLAIAYVTAWNPTSGILLNFLPFPFTLYGYFGLILLFGVVHLPIVFLLLEQKLERLDTNLIEAARLSGASRLSVFTKIELPLLLPTLLSAFSLCLTLNISAFAIPAWIGAPEKIYPLTFKIYQTMQLGGIDGIREAACLSFILIVLTALPLLLEISIYRKEKRYQLLSGKSSRKAVLNSSSWPKTIGFQLFFWGFQILFWVTPLTTLIMTTLIPPGCFQNSGFECLSQISLHKYSYVLFELSETRQAFWGSLVYGGIASFLIIVISITALFLAQNNKRALQMINSLFNILLSTPGAVLALGLILVYSGRWQINLYNTPSILILAFVLKHSALSFQSLRTGFMNISKSLLEAAKLSGATGVKTWLKITLPILKPEWMGGFFLVLIPILGELTMSVFLVGPTFKTVGTVLFDLQDYADQAAAAALSIILVMVILIFNELTRFLSRGKLGY